MLKILTNHGKTIEVPDFTSLTVNEAKHEAAQSKLRVEVIDSIFVRKWKRSRLQPEPETGLSCKTRQKDTPHYQCEERQESKYAESCRLLYASGQGRA